MVVARLMSISIISSEVVRSCAVRQLGLDPNTHAYDSREAISFIIRRAAAFASPCTHSELTRMVESAMTALTESIAQTEGVIEEVIDDLLSNGDLVEADEATDPGASGIYLAPPTFVMRKGSHHAILIGSLPGNLEGIPPFLEHRIELRGVLRRVRSHPDEDLPGLLEDHGFTSIKENLWLARPKAGAASEVVEQMNRVLKKSPAVGPATGFVILDPQKTVTYYKGRWAPVKNQTGKFVARRPQQFGNALWCYVELFNGQLVSLVDFHSGDWRACDYAWHLQFAIDKINAQPQVYTVLEQDSEVLIKFFSPIPSWVRRRWQLIGTERAPQDCLLAFALPSDEFAEEQELILHGALFMQARSY